MKIIFDASFAASMSDPCDLVNNSKFYPRVLVTTSSCVGVGLDSSSACSMIIARFPASMIALIQEMDRCRRPHSDDGTNPIDDFLFLSL